MVEDKLRSRFDYYLSKTEIVIYSILAVLLAVTAFVTIATAGQILWIDLSHWTVAAQTLRVLNQLLIVLMLVEILHTVYLHSLACSGYGTLSGRRTDCLHSAHSGDYPGSCHSHQGRCMGDRRRAPSFALRWLSLVC